MIESAKENKGFKYIIKNNEVTITDCGDFGEGDIVIPGSIDGYPVASIGYSAFDGCTSLTSITIGNCVTSIGSFAFGDCLNLKSPSANYKVFSLHSDGKISCRGYEFCENKWSDEIENIELCKSGYHYCTNLFEIFNYYYGTLDKDIAIYLCDVGDNVMQSNTSKCVTNKIKPAKRLYREDVIRILNGKTV